VLLELVLLVEDDVTTEALEVEITTLDVLVELVTLDTELTTKVLLGTVIGVLVVVVDAVPVVLYVVMVVALALQRKKLNFKLVQVFLNSICMMMVAPNNSSTLNYGLEFEV